MIGIWVSVDQSALKCPLFLSLLHLHYVLSCSTDVETESLSGISPSVQMFLEEKAYSSRLAPVVFFVQHKEGFK